MTGGYPRGATFGAEVGNRTKEGREQFLAYWRESVDLGDTPGGGARGGPAGGGGGGGGGLSGVCVYLQRLWRMRREMGRGGGVMGRGRNWRGWRERRGFFLWWALWRGVGGRCIVRLCMCVRNGVAWGRGGR
jgi:hypothetical protein